MNRPPVRVHGTLFDLPCRAENANPDSAVRGARRSRRSVTVGRLTMLCVCVAGLAFAPRTARSQAEARLDAGLPEPASVSAELTLDDACGIALSNSPTLAAISARLSQAAERVRQARAVFWPSVGVSADGVRIGLSDRAQDARMLPGGPVADETSDVFSASLKVGYTVFDGFLREASLALARAAERETLAEVAEGRRLLTIAVIRAYYRAMLAIEESRIAKADFEFNARLLKDAAARRASGAGALSDELNFQVRMNQASAALAMAEAEARSAMVVLESLMGLEEGEVSPSRPLSELEPEGESLLKAPEVEDELESALINRPDLDLARYGIARSMAERERIAAGRLPSLRVHAGVTAERPDDPGIGGEDVGYSVGITLAYDLFDGGLLRAQRREADARGAEALERERERRVAVVADVRGRVVAVAAAQNLLAVNAENAELVRRLRDMVEEEYRQGAASLVRLNEAQRDFIGAEGRLAMARVSLRLAWRELDAAVGRLPK